MKIQYLGHACFMLDDSLVIDPYKDGSVPGLAPLRVKANRVICSHEHADHSGAECVEIVPRDEDAKRVASGGEDFEIEEVPSFHDDRQGELRGRNTIFIIKKNGEKLVHLGDLGHFPDENQLAKISKADYLLIPVGGYYTIDAETAVRICQTVKPKHVIPMHYRTPSSGYDTLATLADFYRAKGIMIDQAGIVTVEDFFFELYKSEGMAASNVSSIIGVLIGVKPCSVEIVPGEIVERFNQARLEELIKKLGLGILFFRGERGAKDEGEIVYYVYRDEEKARQAHDEFQKLWRLIDECSETELAERRIPVDEKIGSLLGYPETAIAVFSDKYGTAREERMRRNRYYAHSEEFENEEFESYDRAINQAVLAFAPKTARFFLTQKEKRLL